MIYPWKGERGRRATVGQAYHHLGLDRAPAARLGIYRRACDRRDLFRVGYRLPGRRC